MANTDDNDLGDLIGDLNMDDAGQPTGFVANVISRGRPCRCGPGFCATEHGVGYYGYCRGKREGEDARDPCPRCGAPHQSDDGCWLCGHPDKADGHTGAAFWLRCLEEGVNGCEVFDVQDAARVADGEFLSCDEALDRILEQRKMED